jgi:L-rhamnose mutarotase
MQRFGTTLRLRSEHEAAYRSFHKAVWPEVLARISACHIRNYSIFLHGGILFAYFEYHGEDFAADMQRMADDPKTQEWWSIMNPMQDPYSDRAPGEWWSNMEEVFHHD